MLVKLLFIVVEEYDSVGLNKESHYLTQREFPTLANTEEKLYQAE